jgi:quercetin dioxygenase-like cupin family protein
MPPSDRRAVTTRTSPHQSDAGQIPPDDPARRLAAASPDRDEALEHLGVVGDTYTILLSGRDTGGRYTLIDMHVPSGGGPPPHRHDFEEMFSVLDGEIELTVRGETSTAQTGDTVNIPANSPHVFRNASDRPARLLCLCAPPGQEDFFREVGVPLVHRTHGAAPARRGRPGGVHRQGHGTRAQIPNRTAARTQRDLTPSREGHGHSIHGAAGNRSPAHTSGFSF